MHMRQTDERNNFLSNSSGRRSADILTTDSDRSKQIMEIISNYRTEQIMEIDPKPKWLCAGRRFGRRWTISCLSSPPLDEFEVEDEEGRHRIVIIYQNNIICVASRPLSSFAPSSHFFYPIMAIASKQSIMIVSVMLVEGGGLCGK